VLVLVLVLPLTRIERSGEGEFAREPGRDDDGRDAKTEAEAWYSKSASSVWSREFSMRWHHRVSHLPVLLMVLEHDPATLERLVAAISPVAEEGTRSLADGCDRVAGAGGLLDFDRERDRDLWRA